MNSPDFCCPQCGSRDWWKEANGFWSCNHTSPTSEVTDFWSWYQYIIEEYAETEKLLRSLEAIKATKTTAGRPALVETYNIKLLGIRLIEQTLPCDIAILLHELHEGYGCEGIEGDVILSAPVPLRLHITRRITNGN